MTSRSLSPIQIPSVDADRYRILFENSADAILIIEDGKFVDCNNAVVELLRYSDKRTLLQTHPSELSPEFQPDGRLSFEKANEMMAIAIEQGSHRFEWDHIKADGEVFPVEVLLTAIPSERGYDLHTVWRDISERKKLENELRHAQKMEAIGKLAGGIAHDFNNALMPIMGYADMLASALSDQPKLYKWTQDINRAANRASTLVKKLLAFSRKDIRQPVVLNLSDTVANFLDPVGKLIGEDISVVFEPADDVLLIKTDPGEVEQIVLNLASNARDALPQGGDVLIEVSAARRESHDFALLSLSDNGVGMDDATLQQVFVPFFTTKQLGTGTGLGLSTVYELVKKAGGQIEISSEHSLGTCVSVYFPITSEQAEDNVALQEPELNSQHESSGHQGTVLVVEDDDQVAELIAQALRQEGYRVLEASNGVDALEILRQTKPDLVISDVVMGRMTGPQLVQQMEKERIDVPTLFMSGYTDDKLESLGLRPANLALIRKPFSPACLIEQISAIVGDYSPVKPSNP